jgi:hypothetical protein
MGRESTHYDALEDQPALDFPHDKKQTTQSLAADILSILYTPDANNDQLFQGLQDVVRETGWYEDLAAAVLIGLENALKAEAPMSQAMKVAYEKVAQVVADILGFAKEHPAFCVVIALGLLVVFAPWAVEVLGFGELGPIEGMSVVVYMHGDILMCCLLVGTFAAWWQSTYGGYVPAGSLFSFFQRLGMVWRWKLVTSPAMVVPAK